MLLDNPRSYEKSQQDVLLSQSQVTVARFFTVERRDAIFNQGETAVAEGSWRYGSTVVMWRDDI